MSRVSARHPVGAENVAWGDTPNFVARDLKPLDFQNILAGQGAGSTQLSTTNARHFEIRAGGSGPFEEEDALGEGGTPTGNVVSVEQELIKLSDTQIQYQTATNLYTKA